MDPCLKAVSCVFSVLETTVDAKFRKQGNESKTKFHKAATSKGYHLSDSYQSYHLTSDVLRVLFFMASHISYLCLRLHTLPKF